MAWERSLGELQQTLTAGSCQAIIKQSPAKVWWLGVVRAGVAIEHDSFDTVADAQAWCETRLDELEARDQCE